MEKKVGEYSFIVGVVIAIILGLALPISATIQDWLTSVLVLLGLIVGFMNVAGKESKDFLAVATMLVIVAYAGGAAAELGKVEIIGPYLRGILASILTFVVPAVVIVALKQIRALAENK